MGLTESLGTKATFVDVILGKKLYWEANIRVGGVISYFELNFWHTLQCIFAWNISHFVGSLLHWNSVRSIDILRRTRKFYWTVSNLWRRWAIWAPSERAYRKIVSQMNLCRHFQAYSVRQRTHWYAFCYIQIATQVLYYEQVDLIWYHTVTYINLTEMDPKKFTRNILFKKGGDAAKAEP